MIIYKVCVFARKEEGMLWSGPRPRDIMNKVYKQIIFASTEYKCCMEKAQSPVLSCSIINVCVPYFFFSSFSTGCNFGCHTACLSVGKLISQRVKHVFCPWKGSNLKIIGVSSFLFMTKIDLPVIRS